MFEEFLMDKEEIRKNDLEREREENENNFKKRITIIEKEEKKRKNILDEYGRLKDTLKFKEDEFKRLRKPYEQHYTMLVQFPKQQPVFTWERVKVSYIHGMFNMPWDS